MAISRLGLDLDCSPQFIHYRGTAARFRQGSTVGRFASRILPLQIEGDDGLRGTYVAELRSFGIKLVANDYHDELRIFHSDRGG